MNSDPSPDACPICQRPNFHPSDHHLVPKSRKGKVTETICRDCHRAIHATFTNKELERERSTVETLLAHEGFAKMVAFIRKQDPGGKVRMPPAKHYNPGRRRSG
ncbi:MAG: hypothetical protein U0359_16845 [Byssovorax sp.]